MKNDIQLFSNTQFGQLSVLVIAGKEYFPATDAARMLGRWEERRVGKAC